VGTIGSFCCASWSISRTPGRPCRRSTVQLELIFPGLTGCFTHGLDAASLRVLIRDLPDPDRVRRLGTEGVLRYVRRRGVRMTRPKAEHSEDDITFENRQRV
jgi:hypothetical protein